MVRIGLLEAPDSLLTSALDCCVGYCAHVSPVVVITLGSQYSIMSQDSIALETLLPEMASNIICHLVKYRYIVQETIRIGWKVHLWKCGISLLAPVSGDRFRDSFYSARLY
jgi:hypothetical protein